MIALRGTFALAVTAALWSGCQSSPGASSGGAGCTYQQEIGCVGAAACPGRRTCLPDLTGYGPCECTDAGPADAGPREAGRPDAQPG